MSDPEGKKDFDLVPQGSIVDGKGVGFGEIFENDRVTDNVLVTRRKDRRRGRGSGGRSQGKPYNPNIGGGGI